MNRTHARHGARLTAALMVAMLAAVFPSTPLAAQGPGDLAAATTYAGGVDFRPYVGYSRAVLRVSGNGTTFQRLLEAGDDLSIGMFDPDGQLLREGVYTWELQLVPDEQTARELRIAASLNGGEAPEPWTALSGSFAVRGGSIATPDLGEPEPVPDSLSAISSGLPVTLGAQRAAGFGRATAVDSDDAVGFEEGVEERVRAASQKQVPSGAAGALRAPDPRGLQRSDEAALALGGSLEPIANQINQGAQSRRAQIRQRPVSDGTNGRPRENQ